MRFVCIACQICLSYGLTGHGTKLLYNLGITDSLHEGRSLAYPTTMHSKVQGVMPQSAEIALRSLPQIQQDAEIPG